MERRILFFTCVAHALTHIYIANYSALLEPMGSEFGADITQYATISTVLFGVGAIPSSWLGHWLGEKKLLVAFFLLSALGGTLIGLASGPVPLAAGMACLGLGTSIFHPVGNSLIAKGIREPGRAMGTNGMWGNIGEALGPLLAAGIAAVLFWRWSYLALTIPALAAGAWLGATRIELATAPSAGGQSLGGAARSASRGVAPIVALLLLAMMCGGFQFWIVKTQLPTFLKERTSPSLLPDSLRGGWLTAAIYLIGGYGQLLAGRVVHGREGRGLYVAVFLLSVPLLYAVGRMNGAPLLVTAGVMSILIFAAQPIENVLLARFAPPDWASLLFGLKFTLAFGVGGLGTALSGWVQRRYGTGEAFTTAAMFTAVALLLATVAWRSRRYDGSGGGESAKARAASAASDR